MDYKDYYKILGVPRSATAEEIKRAYRKLAREYHPDRNRQAGAENRFKEINEAHEVLGDPEKRRTYDSLGANWQGGRGFTPPPGWQGGRGRRGGSSFGQAEGFSDFFSAFFGGGGMPGGFGDFETADFRTRPSDRHAELSISLEDAFHGAERELLLDGRTLKVRIPAGIREGQSIRLNGQGTHGGSLLLKVKYAPHPWLQVQGRDVHARVDLAPWEAALGARVSVPTLGGAVELNIPANSQGGQRLRLKGRGLPGKTPGDQIVTLNILTPPAETEAQRAFYRDMAARFDFRPRG
jgi:curved DNA-binding protein